MKKSNKGFTLLETLIVTTFVVTTLIYLFIQISNIKVSYDITFRYNTVPGVYNALNISNYVDDEGYKSMANGLYFNTKTYYDLNDNTYIDGGISDFYDALVSKIDAKNIIFVSEDLTTLNTYLETGTLTETDKAIFNEDFIKFISKIEFEGITGVYRVIIEYKDKTYATVKIGDTTKDLINPVVSNLQTSGVNGTFTITDNVALSDYGCNQSSTVEPTWTSTSGTTASVSCAVASAGTYYAWAKDTSGNTSNSTFVIEQSAFAPTCITTKSNLGTTSGVTVVVSGTGITSGAGTFTGVTSSRTYTVYNAANVSATCSVTVTSYECNCSSTPKYCCDYQAYDANGNWYCAGSYLYCGDNRYCSTCYN